MQRGDISNGICEKRTKKLGKGTLPSVTALWIVILQKMNIRCRMSFAVTGITDRADKGDHMASDVPLGEAGASVRKQVVPFALEGFIIRTVLQCRIILGEVVLREISLQSATPFSESTWIVWIRERKRCVRD